MMGAQIAFLMSSKSQCHIEELCWAPKRPSLASCLFHLKLNGPWFPVGHGNVDGDALGLLSAGAVRAIIFCTSV